MKKNIFLLFNLAFIFALISCSSSKLPYSSIKSFSEGLSLISIDSKFGYMNEDLKLAINPVFEIGTDFVDDYATVKSNGFWGVINKEGHFVLNPEFDSITIINDSSEMMFFTIKNNVVKIIDKNNNILFNFTNCNFNSDLTHINDFIAFKNNDKYILITPSKKSFIESDFEDINVDVDNRLIVFKKNNKYGLSDFNGKILLEADYDNLCGFSENMAIIEKNKKFGFINLETLDVIDPIYENALKFSEGLASVKLRNSYGYIDKSNKMIIEPNFNFASSFKNGVASVLINNSNGLIDKEGNLLTKEPFFIDNDSKFSNGLLPICKKVEDKFKYGYLNEKGKEVIPVIYDKADNFTNNYAIVEVNNKKGALDTTGQVVIPIEYDYIINFLDYFIVSKNKNYGLLDNTGQVIIPLKYDNLIYHDLNNGNLQPNPSNPILIFRKKNKFGAINLKDEILIKPIYDELNFLNENILSGKIKNNYDFILLK